MNGFPELTIEQAEFVKHLRLVAKTTWRRLAREFTRKFPDFDHGYGTDRYNKKTLKEYVEHYNGDIPKDRECSNQMLGQDLHKVAAETLNEDWNDWDEG